MALGWLISYAFVMSLFFIGSTHSCDVTALQKCNDQLLSLASEVDPAVVCRNYDNYKDCADSAKCSSVISLPDGMDNNLCAEWRNKGGNGVSTLTPRLTFIMAIVFVVMTFTRLMK